MRIIIKIEDVNGATVVVDPVERGSSRPGVAAQTPDLNAGEAQYTSGGGDVAQEMLISSAGGPAEGDIDAGSAVQSRRRATKTQGRDRR